jgi:hypothetical protein
MSDHMATSSGLSLHAIEFQQPLAPYNATNCEELVQFAHAR